MRIISKIETKTGWAVKGRKLEGIRKLGKPEEFAYKYYKSGVDEIIFLDSVASLYGRGTLDEVIEKVSENVFVPMTVGGGIRKLSDCKRMFESGADKISLNTILFEDPSILKKISKIYGSQALVVEVQAKKIGNGYECLCEYGREFTGINLIDWLKKLRKFPIGELHLISVDKDGMNQGIDKELIEISREFIEVPFIYSGGFNPLKDDLKWLSQYLEGLCMASCLHLHSVDPSEFSQRCN